jgi:hypothetical protein
MSFENPTSVKVGMSGTFSGINYRVLGRVVMGVVDDGATYYWNEFNLQADNGEFATLVYEVTENGGEWRWFTMFEPQFPITAADAATKRIGDPLNLDGTDVRVTLRDYSRVYHIEGQAPEGVDLGDRAEYFNAEVGKTMIVVSWTGEDVECYHGVTISASTVAQAFNIPFSSFARFTLAGTDSTQSSHFWLIFASGLLVLFVCIAAFPVISRSRPPAIVRIAAPSAKLIVGNSGKLNGNIYTIISDALVEINEVGIVYQRHEFHLRDENGNGALLIRGWKPGVKDWCLFNLIEPSEPMTPQQAAAVKCGQRIALPDSGAQVGALFRSTVLQVNTSDILQSTTGKVFYGFGGGSGVTLLLARWDDSFVTVYEGYPLNAKPDDAFTQPSAK